MFSKWYRCWASQRGMVMDPLMVFGLIMIGYIGHLVSDIRAEVRLMNGHLKGLDTETLLNQSND